MPAARTKRSPHSGPRPRRVCLVALPDAVVSTIAGLYDVLRGATTMGLTAEEPFAVETVGEARGPLMLASGVPIDV